MRKIIHIDMDAFFASVEQLDAPTLRGRPVIVGGDPSGRGVVAAASYEARAFGVHSAMPASRARRLCPDAVFLRPRFQRYVEVSRQLRAIFHRATGLVEPLSLDEAYLDVTDNHLGVPLARDLARWLKDQVRAETGLTASAGVGPSKLVAKIASDYDKPDGLVVIAPQRVRAFLASLPVEKLWGVGPATARRLHGLGFRTCAELARADVAVLGRALGQHGLSLHRLARGDDPRRVQPHRPPKSRGAERTFARDVRSLERLAEALAAQADEVGAALQRVGRRGRTVVLKVRYDDFTTITRSRTLARPTDAPEDIAATALSLLRAATEAGERPVRLLGVAVQGLDDPDDPAQLELPLAAAREEPPATAGDR